MNILFLIERLTGGGAERVCVSVANGLSSMGHSISILTYAVSQRDYDLNSQIKVFKASTTGGRFKRQYRESKRFISIIKECEINIVVNILGVWFPQCIVICKFLGVKLVFSDHNPYERPANAKFPFSFQQILNKFYFSRLCDCTTVLTRRDKEILEKRKKVVIMPNPLFLPVSKEIPIKKKIVLAVGRFHVWEVKGFDLLIKIWGNICHEFPDWTLKFIGDCNENQRQIINGFIDENKADRIIIEPFKKNIIDDYRNSEIFVLSSRYEGFGLVLIEAMSQRCACIACDYNTRQSDIITDGVDGLLCKTNDIDDLTDKLRRLIIDAELRNTLQHNSTQNLYKYSEVNIARKWETFLKKIIFFKLNDKDISNNECL